MAAAAAGLAHAESSNAASSSQSRYTRSQVAASTAFIPSDPPAAPSPAAFTVPAILLDAAEAAAAATSSSSLQPTTPARVRRGTKVKGKGKSSAAHAAAHATQQHAVKTCEALDRWSERCTEVVIGGHKGKVSHKWCAVHEQEQSTVASEFFDCLKEIRVPRNQPTAADVMRMDDLDELEEMERTVQAQFDSCSRALDYREYHRKHFAADGDLLAGFEDLLPVAELQRRREEAESVLRVITTTSHVIILQSEDALWLLVEPSATPPPCISTSPSPLKAPGAPSLQTETDEPDPLLALERVQRAEVLELLSLTGSHASFIRDGRKSVERVRIVECLFRRLISRDPELLVKAYRGGHDHVLRFFEDPLLCSLPALRRLHTALQQTSSLSLREAITDAFRAIAWEESGAGETEEGEEGLGLQLLGGWVYKIQLPRSLTPREWGHLYDLNGCPGCAVRCCVRFQDLATIRRLTVCPAAHASSTAISANQKATATPQTPPYELWGEVNETDANRIMRALDVVRCAESGSGASEPEIRRVGGGLVGSKGKGVWVERIERNWMFVKVSNAHPKIISILSALAKMHVLVVRSRLTPRQPLLPSHPLPPSSHLWFYRHRSAPAKPELKHQAWATDPDGFGPGNSHPASILATLDTLDSPEKAQGMSPFSDAYEILILDGFGLDGEGSGRAAGDASTRSFERFEAQVGLVMAEACGADGVKSAIEWGTRESYRRGDLLWDFNGSKDQPQQQQGKIVGGGGGKSKPSVSSVVTKAVAAAVANKASAAVDRGVVDINGHGHGHGHGGNSVTKADTESLTAGVLDLVKGAFREAGVDPVKAMEMGVEVEVRRELEALAVNGGGGGGGGLDGVSSPASDGNVNGGGDVGDKGTVTAGTVDVDAGVREKVASGVLNSLRDDQLAFKLSRSLFRSG